MFLATVMMHIIVLIYCQCHTQTLIIKHLWYENGKGRRFLKPVLHNMSNKKLLVDENCINRSLLTSRTLTQIRDIEGARLWRHAKTVEANCKKALSLCTASDSPYKNFNGTFPSGTDYEDYLQWIRKQMWEKSRDTDSRAWCKDARTRKPQTHAQRIHASRS